MTETPLWQRSATEVVALLRTGDVSPLELIDVAAARIEAVNPAVNALPVLCLERARRQARALDPGERRNHPGWLAGLPVAVKDYNDVEGVVTSHGSPIHAGVLAACSDATVRRLEHNGALPIGKSNVPEFAGANTFNPVYGATRNPWDLRMSVAGSSGGSAAALASGMCWLATGNDLGGSLRTPASFCGVVGLRPSPGRVPRSVDRRPFDPLWVEGPMARSVGDVALMLEAACGAALGDPLAFDSRSGEFVEAVADPRPPRRIAFSPDLGVVPMEPEIAGICRAAAMRFGGLGTEVTDDIPDFTGSVDAFQVLRAVLFAVNMGDVLARERERISPDIVWNIEKGLSLDAEAIRNAEQVRGELFQRVSAFFEHHDLLCCPAASVPPYPVEQRYPAFIAGRASQTYIDWIAITFAITLTGCPAISLPCGFTDAGLPVGLQLVGPPRGEARLLAAARALEAELGVSARVPIDPRPRAVAAE